jgi:hypothetical protein
VAYCTLDDVKALAAQLDISATTKPTTTQATNILTDIQAELDMYLLSLGYTLPIAAGKTQLLEFLRVACAYGTAAGVFRARLDFSGAQTWDNKYHSVRKHLPALTATSGGDIDPFGTGFPAYTEDGEEIEPWTTRLQEY